jgi:hypothetical protein
MAEQRRPRLPIVKRFRAEDGALVPSLNAETEPVSLVYDFNGDTIEVALSDFANHVKRLAAYGLRALLNSAFTGAESIAEAREAFDEKVQSVLDGTFSERGGERGINTRQFCSILAALTGKSEAEILATLQAKEAALVGKDIQERTLRNGEVIEEDAFDRWINAIRGRPDYKAKASELFPRQRKSKTQAASIEDLL